MERRWEKVEIRILKEGRRNEPRKKGGKLWTTRAWARAVVARETSLLGSLCTYNTQIKSLIM